MNARRCLLWVLFPSLVCATVVSADPATQPVAPAPPQKVTAYAYVTVRPPQGASKATQAFIAKAAADAIPTERFAKLTLGKEDTLAKARVAAIQAKAQVFLHLTCAAPQIVEFTQKIGSATVMHQIRRRRPRGWRRGRGDGGDGDIEITLYAVRTPLTVEMSVATGTQWRAARVVRLTSAEVPGAERDEGRKPESPTKPWAQALGLMAPVAVERALLLHFLTNVQVRAIECEPVDPDKADAPADADDKNARQPQVPQTLVKMELTNQSHCRITDASVTVERFNEARKRWEAVDAPRGLREFLRRFGRNRRDREATTLSWPVPADVDPGEKAFSEKRPVGEGIFQAMKNRKCRLVLHATPVVWTLRPSRLAHPLKPAPKPTP